MMSEPGKEGGRDERAHCPIAFLFSLGSMPWILDADSVQPMKYRTFVLLAILIVFGGNTNVALGAASAVTPVAKATVLNPGLQPKKSVAPLYPQELYDAGVSGQVKVFVQVNRSGEVLMAQVEQSTDRRFEVPSIKAALKWRFISGLDHGEILFDFQSPVKPAAPGGSGN
jgi:TonB family protein